MTKFEEAQALALHFQEDILCVLEAVVEVYATPIIFDTQEEPMDMSISLWVNLRTATPDFYIEILENRRLSQVLYTELGDTALMIFAFAG